MNYWGLQGVMQQKKAEGYQVSVVNTPNCSEFTLENAKYFFLQCEGLLTRPTCIPASATSACVFNKESSTDSERCQESFWGECLETYYGCIQLWTLVEGQTS